MQMQQGRAQDLARRLSLGGSKGPSFGIIATIAVTFT